MDSDRFDALTRAFGSGRSRRGVLKALAGASLGAIAAAIGLDDASATARCRASGVGCSASSDCCSSNCLPKDRTGRRYCANCGSPAQCPPATDACHVATCLGGACGITTAVPAGFALCNGACVNTTSDLANCGGCGTRCAFAHAGATCTAGVCSLGTCDAGYANCDATSANGCEVNLATDVNHCGDCNNVCSTPVNGTATCVAGTCGSVCAEGSTLCNGACMAAASFQTDPANCGACGNLCTTGVANAAATCVNGTCDAPCNSGFTLCNGACVATSGFQADQANCGACGNVCGGGGECSAPVCASGVCATMPTNEGGSCQNGAGVCGSGTCVPTDCPSGSTFCGGGCTDLSRDPSNCGSCGHACGVIDCNTALCDASSCVYTPTGNTGVPCHNGTGVCDNLGNCNSCTPNCAGRCGGVSDGCGGSCNATCVCVPNCAGKCGGVSDGCSGFCNTGCPCAPDCAGKCGGVSDGCGGTCDASCVCTPDCTGKCGGASDGCDGTCDATCVCVPNCAYRCGGVSDGCGGTCDSCPPAPDCNTVTCYQGDCYFNPTGVIGTCNGGAGTCDVNGNCDTCASGVVCSDVCCVNTGDGPLLCSGTGPLCTCYHQVLIDNGFSYQPYFC